MISIIFNNKLYIGKQFSMLHFNTGLSPSLQYPATMRACARTHELAHTRTRSSPSTVLKLPFWESSYKSNIYLNFLQSII